MKLIREKMEFEGTPEEYERALLKEFFQPGRVRNGIANGNDGGDVADSARALPPAIQDFLDNRVPRGDAREVVEAVIAGALAWGDVTVRPGGGQSAEKYVLLRRRRSPYGAFVYVHPTYAHVRLTADAAEGMTYAQARDVQPSNPHQVVVPLDDRAALDEVLALVRTAYDQAVG